MRVAVCLWRREWQVGSQMYNNTICGMIIPSAWSAFMYLCASDDRTERKKLLKITTATGDQCLRLHYHHHHSRHHHHSSSVICSSRYCMRPVYRSNKKINNRTNGDDDDDDEIFIVYHTIHPMLFAQNTIFRFVSFPFFWLKFCSTCVHVLPSSGNFLLMTRQWWTDMVEFQFKVFLVFSLTKRNGSKNHEH